MLKVEKKLVFPFIDVGIFLNFLNDVNMRAIPLKEGGVGRKNLILDMGKKKH